jgi:hypothetical protein
LRGLKPNSGLLETLRKAFLQMLEDEHFAIHLFFETKSMVGVYGMNGLVRLFLRRLLPCYVWET